MAQASYSSPPGLESPNAVVHRAASEVVRLQIMQCLEEKLSQLAPAANRQQIVEAVKEAMVQEVGQRFSAEADKLWLRGKQALTKMQQRHNEETIRLQDELSKCIAKQRAYEEEQEKLKQVLQQLASHISMLGTSFGSTNKQNLTASPGAESSTAAGQSPQQTEGSFVGEGPYTPGPFTPGPAGSLASLLPELANISPGSGKLPDVPAFPFPSQQSPSAAPLSLAEALGGNQTPKRTPLSLATTLASPEAAMSPFSLPSMSMHSALQGASTFSFTIRKADGADLGLNVSHNQTDEPVLKVEGVRPDGAVEAWNKQCAVGVSQAKVVRAGDRIISVNAVSGDPVKMLEECKEKKLLKLTIVRDGFPLPPFPAKATSLRADASVFVPSSADAAKSVVESDVPVETSAPLNSSIIYASS